MANFRTHISVAAVGGAALAFLGSQAQWWPASQALLIGVLTAFGGILPDIDADRSRSIRLIFSLLSVPALVLGVILLQDWLSPGSLLMACGGIYLAVRYVSSAVFAHLTVHRGVWHSLLAGALCGMTAVVTSFQLLAQSAWFAWSHGLAIVVGFVIHLTLDELYSVDLEGARLKRSFGTALKLADCRRPLASLLMLIATLTLVPWLPPWADLWELLHQGSLLWR